MGIRPVASGCAMMIDPACWCARFNTIANNVAMMADIEVRARESAWNHESIADTSAAAAANLLASAPDLLLHPIAAAHRVQAPGSRTCASLFGLGLAPAFFFGLRMSPTSGYYVLDAVVPRGKPRQQERLVNRANRRAAILRQDRSRALACCLAEEGRATRNCCGSFEASCLPVDYAMAWSARL
jgi:hypothetical protein